MTLLEPRMLLGLVGVLALLALGALGALLAARARRRFLDRAPAAAAPRPGRARRTLAAALGALGLCACVLALARPAHDPKPRKVERSGRDVVFAIDVSRSMLATDLKPSRLQRAKLAVSDVLDVIDGDRVGLVAFAGTAVTKCPLTTDYAFVRMGVEDLSPNSVSRGGTALGEALRASLTLLFAESDASGAKPPPRTRTIILITDGEDHESLPLAAAEKAAQRDVRIVTIGLGSDSAGAPVPIGDAPPDRAAARTAADAFLQHRGQVVQSRMDPGILKQIAQATPGGVFLNVGTGNVELDTVYQRLMRSAPAPSVEVEESVTYTELFQFALATGIFLLALESLLNVRFR